MGTEGIIEHGTVDLVVGAVFVLFYSANRFNTPPTNRSSTTAGRYFPAMIIYCLGATLLYFLLVNFPDLVTFFAGGDTDNLPSFVRELSSPLVMALMLTVLLPKLPLLSNADHWILEQLQGMAAIPYEVRRLSAELRGQSLALAPSVQDDVRRRLVKEGFDARDIRFDPGQEPEQQWTAVTALLVQLEKWESDRRMAAYVQASEESLVRIRERHRALIPKAKTCFKLLRQSGGSDETDKAREAAQRYAEDFVEQVTSVNSNLIDFISRGILASEFTDGARAHRLTVLGFTPGPRLRVELTLNQMMSLFLIVGVLVISSFGMLGQSNGLTRGQQLARAVLIAISYSVAVACVVIPRQRWKFAQREPDGPWPVAFYLVAGLLAVAITQLISFGYSWAVTGSFGDGVQRYRLSFPWFLMAFATSFLTGFLIDTSPPVHIPRRIWRVIEGIIGCVVMMMAAVLTHGWLMERFEIFGSDLPPGVKYTVPHLAAILAPAGMVGFAIGYLVPGWFRKTPGVTATLEAPALGPAG